MLKRVDSQTIVMAALPVAFYALFVIVPLGVAVALSFQTWNGLAPATWAGLRQWRRLLDDPVVWGALGTTLRLMVYSWLLQTPVSLALGVFLAGRERYRDLLAIVFFLPLMFSAVAIGLTWIYILDPSFGVVTALARDLHLQPQSWLGQRWVLVTLSAVIAWEFIPFHTLLYQAAAQQIPTELYEAAEIDGAGLAGRFWRITVPQLRYTFVTSSLLILVGSLTYFDLILVMTQGGPGYRSTVLSIYMYNEAFPKLHMGYGSAIAVLLAVLGVILSLILLRVSGFTRMRSELEVT
jgi:raffinose/stachyose/melibiose transport system permease protein